MKILGTRLLLPLIGYWKIDDQQWQLLLNYCSNFLQEGAEKFPTTDLVNYDELFIDKLPRGKLPGDSRDDGNFL